MAISAKLKSESRYLDAASLDSSIRFNDGVPSHRKNIEFCLPYDIGCFFSTNTTRAIEAVLTWFCNKKSFGIELVGSNKPHPVIDSLLRELSIPKGGNEKIELITLVDWITGNVDSSKIAEILNVHGNGRVIIDAAQAFGCLDAKAVSKLIGLTKKGGIICGCLQKWLGSPIPVGFSLFDRELLRSDDGFARFLGARDYLGSSIPGRPGELIFPDTFTTFPADFIGESLSLLFGSNPSALDALAKQISENRTWLLTVARTSKAIQVIECEKGLGMIGITGDASVIEALSGKLMNAGFFHTSFNPEDTHLKVPIIRLSAPRVPIPMAVKNELAALIRNA